MTTTIFVSNIGTIIITYCFVFGPFMLFFFLYAERHNMGKLKQVNFSYDLDDCKGMKTKTVKKAKNKSTKEEDTKVADKV